MLSMSCQQGVAESQSPSNSAGVLPTQPVILREMFNLELCIVSIAYPFKHVHLPSASCRIYFLQFFLWIQIQSIFFLF